jgi:tetratricopeptide (TPR) repeat protein
MQKHTLALAAIILVIMSQASAETLRMNLRSKWSNVMPSDIGAVVLTDGTGDGRAEIYVGLKNTTVIVLDYIGRQIDEFSLGNPSEIGTIYSMAAADLDGDGINDIIYGLGGARNTRTYDSHDFEFDGLSVTQQSKVLYRILRYHGGVYATKANGRLLWRYLTLDSVKSVDYLPHPDGGYVLAGVGDLMVLTYNERSDDPVTDRVCTTEERYNELTGWSNAENCLDMSKCCSGYNICSCRWDPETQQCFRDYTYVDCRRVPSGTVGWKYVDYPIRNGSVYLLDKKGALKLSQSISLYDERGYLIENVDNSIRSITHADLDLDGVPEILAGSNNGGLFAFNASNISHMRRVWAKTDDLFTGASGQVRMDLGSAITKVYAKDLTKDTLPEIAVGNSLGLLTVYRSDGGVLWRQRLDDAITDIRAADVESDGLINLIVTTRKGDIHAYSPYGVQLWRYQTKSPIYNLWVMDLDRNELMEFITFKENNITVYETTEFYIKKFRADSFYTQAYEKFNQEDYTSAAIILDRAYRLYLEIDDRDSIPKVRLLDSRITDNLMFRKKEEGDRFYNLALGYYANNDLESSMKFLEQAREVYAFIGDDEGIRKVSRLMEGISDDLREQKRIKADGLYTRASTTSSFGDYEQALELISQARELYTQAGYLNETVKLDVFLIEMGDRHYRLGQTHFQGMDFEKAMEYGLFSMRVYGMAGNRNASAKAGELARLANESLHKPPEDEGARPANFIYYALAVVLVLFIGALIHMKTSSTSSATFSKKPKILDVQDDDLETIEREEGI